jgi:hypothetical protein
MVSGYVEKHISALPGITEHRFNQLQEIEAVLNLLNIKLRKIRRTHFQKYLEKYQRALTSRDAEKYVDGEDEVIDFEYLINEVALLRNKYLGIMKGLDAKHERIRCKTMANGSYCPSQNCWNGRYSSRLGEIMGK